MPIFEFILMSLYVLLRSPSPARTAPHTTPTPRTALKRGNRTVNLGGFSWCFRGFSQFGGLFPVWGLPFDFGGLSPHTPPHQIWGRAGISPYPPASEMRE